MLIICLENNRESGTYFYSASLRRGEIKLIAEMRASSISSFRC